MDVAAHASGAPRDRGLVDLVSWIFLILSGMRTIRDVGCGDGNLRNRGKGVDGLGEDGIVSRLDSDLEQGTMKRLESEQVGCVLRVTNFRIGRSIQRGQKTRASNVAQWVTLTFASDRLVTVTAKTSVLGVPSPWKATRKPASTLMR